MFRWFNPQFDIRPVSALYKKLNIQLISNIQCHEWAWMRYSSRINIILILCKLIINNTLGPYISNLYQQRCYNVAERIVKFSHSRWTSWLNFYNSSRAPVCMKSIFTTVGSFHTIALIHREHLMIATVWYMQAKNVSTCLYWLLFY